MKKNILLYNPKTVFYDMPLALIALGSQLEKEYNVIIIDGRLDDVPAKMAAYIDNTLAIGVTTLTGAPLRDAIEFTKMVKQLHPGLPVIWGGWHTSLFLTDVLKDVPEVDITVEGQGEITFKKIITSIENKLSLSGINGIAYRDDTGSIVRTSPAKMIDMNDLPRMNYDLIDVERYFQAKGRRQFDFISSTGCYFRCTFCADPFVFGRKFNSLDPKRLANDLLYFHSKYQFQDVNFQDETFFTYPKNILKFAEILKENGAPFTWAATMRADQGSRMTLEDFKTCKESGLRRLLIGVESGSQEMMDWLKKDIKIEQVRECAERCRSLGISAIFPFIVGFPNESEKSVRETKAMIRELALQSKDFETPIFYFKPYPGTRITDDVIANGSYTLPENIEEWSNFDYIGSKGPWVSDKLYSDIERLKFYLKILRQHRTILGPLRWIAKSRVKHLNFSLPVEKMIIEKLRKQKSLS